MISSAERLTPRSPSTFRMATLFASVCPSTLCLRPSRNGAHWPNLNLAYLEAGSHAVKWRKSPDPLTVQTSTGLTTQPVLRSVLPSVLQLSVNCQSGISTLDAVSHTSGACGSLSEVLAVVWEQTDQLLCTTMLYMPSLWPTTQIFSTGISLAFFPRTHQLLMRTASGEHARTQFTTCITRLHGDTSWESHVTCSGTVLCLSQLCHSWTTMVPMLLTELSSASATQFPSSSEAQKNVFCSLYMACNYLNF